MEKKQNKKNKFLLFSLLSLFVSHMGSYGIDDGMGEGDDADEKNDVAVLINEVENFNKENGDIDDLIKKIIPSMKKLSKNKYNNPHMGITVGAGVAYLLRLKDYSRLDLLRAASKDIAIQQGFLTALESKKVKDRLPNYYKQPQEPLGIEDYSIELSKSACLRFIWNKYFENNGKLSDMYNSAPSWSKKLWSHAIFPTLLWSARYCEGHPGTKLVHKYKI